MDMDHTICLHVPGQIQFTQMVEDFTRSICLHFFSGASAHHENLCMVMNEVFTNVVKHSAALESDELVQIRMRINPGTLKISVLDHGPGIMVKNQRPPYNKALIGHSEPFRKVLDGTVYLTVTSPDQLIFTFEDQTLVRDLHQFNGHGFGLSIITKIMDHLSYSALGNGQFTWEMVKKIEP